MRDELAAELEKYNFSLPILRELSVYLAEQGGLGGQTIGWHCHLTEITAATAAVIIESGAKLFVSECNPHTTNEGAVAYMQEIGAQVYIGPDSCLRVLEHKPLILADTGLELTRAYIDLPADSEKDFVFAASEITTSGITALQELKQVPIPVININDGYLKRSIENFHGVGDGVVDALFELTGRIWAGRRVSVVGYGKVGAGVANYLKRMGADVWVVVDDPIERLIAHYDGYPVSDLSRAMRESQLVVTATGATNLVSRQQWMEAADGLLVMNVGHWSTELDLKALQVLSKSSRDVLPHLREYTLAGDKRVLVVAEGSPANVVLLSGSPEPTLIHLTTEVLCMNYLIKLYQSKQTLPCGQATLPVEVERQASILALQALQLMF
ncbi:MAG TPA: NAD(P)-dependent oxidoreductase [Candidatus Obscuribacterales bacterium]